MTVRFASSAHPLALLSALALAAPALAQQAPSATPQPVAQADMTPAVARKPGEIVQPIPGGASAAPVAPRPLPALSPNQAAQLSTLLGEVTLAQGLRRVGSPAPVHASDEALARAALDYARAVRTGRLTEEDFQSDWGLRPPPYDPYPEFVEAVRNDRVAAWFASLPPAWVGYDGLRQGLATYRKIAADGGWHAIPAGPDIGPGAKGGRVVTLRKRLAFEDPQVSTSGDVFDDALKAAVQRAQRRYGLNPTGTVSRQTLAALNVPAQDRVRQIMANMERWRWLPEDLPKDRIQVNIAAAQVAVFDGDRPVMSMRGVTGKPGGGETPMLASTIHSIVVNPPWNVPAGIAQRELFPKGEAYLARNGFKVIGTGANRRLQQAPSHSALGDFKFDFDNRYAVYLHDTPTKGTFSRFDRLASHGCIRLERPADLANLLLKGDPKWTPEAVGAAVAKGETIRVPLQKQVAVYLLYWTAFASSNGAMNFRDDPYGWDKALATKIEQRTAVQALAAR